MARVFRSLRKTLTLTKQFQLQQQQLGISPRRTYISDMRKSAFEANIVRLLRSEIQYELQSSPPKHPVTKFDSFMVNGRPGERWITLKRQFADEDIKVEATMFDGSVPAPSAKGDVANTNDEVQLHITLIVIISKVEGSALEIMCSAWPDSIEIKRLFIRKNENMPAEPYSGPDFEDLDDELQDRLYDFLEVRGITDELASFLHQYVKNKDNAEFISWMERVKSFIEKK